MNLCLRGAIALCAILPSVAVAQSSYELELLPRPAGFDFGFPWSLSEAGYASVMYRPVGGGNSAAFLHDKDGIPARLQGGDAVHGTMSRGAAVGATRADQPVIWFPGGARHTLPAPSGLLTGWAYDINDKGVVTGYMRNAQNRLYAVIWRSGLSKVLPSLGGDTPAYCC